MRRSSLLLLVLIGCGGRDPLYGVDESGGNPPPVSALDAGGPGNNPGTTPPGTTPPSTPDAAVPPNPGPFPRDAGPPRDAGVVPPPMAMCPFPKCLAAVMGADCTPAGMCVQQRVSSGGGLGSNACYSNGVKLVTSLSGGGRNPTASIKVFRADGSLCYSVEPEQRGGGVNAIAYRDASGQQIASATVDRNSLAIACTGSTVPQSVPLGCQPGLTSNGAGGGCRSGMCP